MSCLFFYELPLLCCEFKSSAVIKSSLKMTGHSIWEGWCVKARFTYKSELPDGCPRGALFWGILVSTADFSKKKTWGQSCLGNTEFSRTKQVFFTKAFDMLIIIQQIFIKCGLFAKNGYVFGILQGTRETKIALFYGLHSRRVRQKMNSKHNKYTVENMLRAI